MFFFEQKLLAKLSLANAVKIGVARVQLFLNHFIRLRLKVDVEVDANIVEQGKSV